MCTLNDDTINRISETLAAATSVTGITGIAYRAWQEDDVNMLCLHEAVTEWCGGAQDGEQLVQGFAVDLREMIALFDAMPEIELDATLPADDRAPATVRRCCWKGRSTLTQSFAAIVGPCRRY